MIERLVPLLRRRGFERGVLGNSRVWLGLWATLTVARLMRRATQTKPEVARFSLKPGETLQISHLPPPVDT